MVSGGSALGTGEEQRGISSLWCTVLAFRILHLPIFKRPSLGVNQLTSTCSDASFEVRSS
jgi:hypothetical protein